MEMFPQKQKMELQAFLAVINQIPPWAYMVPHMILPSCVVVLLVFRAYGMLLYSVSNAWIHIHQIHQFPGYKSLFEAHVAAVLLF